MSSSDLPYLAGHIEDALVRDPAIGELDIHITLAGDKIVVSGSVATDERREAITATILRLLPGCDVYNDVTVVTTSTDPGVELLP